VFGDQFFEALHVASRHSRQAVEPVSFFGRTADGVDQRLDSKTLQYLKDEALEFDGNDELAALAADEVEEENKAKKVLQNIALITYFMRHRLL
jgi:hypothetical protein